MVADRTRGFVGDGTRGPSDRPYAAAPRLLFPLLCSRYWNYGANCVASHATSLPFRSGDPWPHYFRTVITANATPNTTPPTSAASPNDEKMLEGPRANNCL